MFFSEHTVLWGHQLSRLLQETSGLTTVFFGEGGCRTRATPYMIEGELRSELPKIRETEDMSQDCNTTSTGNPGRAGIASTFRTALSPLVAFCLASAAPAAPPPLVLDEEPGHYKDMSCEALSDEGLSWEEKTRLFGGETVHYGPLTDEQRKAKEKELEELLAKIDMDLVNKCEADIRAWLETQTGNQPTGDMKNKGKLWEKAAYAAIFLRTCEIFGDKKYLAPALAVADEVLASQSPKGNWGGEMCRIQDHFQDAPFFVLLYAYKLSGDKKYFDGAVRSADLLLSLQNDSGGWPDWWDFRHPDKNTGVVSGWKGVRRGTSHNDEATVAPFRMMIVMYHMTGNRKYLAKLGNLGGWLEGTQLGKGDVAGWCQQYDADDKPVEAREWEIAIPDLFAFTRSVAPLSIWLYCMTGQERYMDFIRKFHRWHDIMTARDSTPESRKFWNEMYENVEQEGDYGRYRPGFPHLYTAEGVCGTAWGYKFYPYDLKVMTDRAVKGGWGWPKLYANLIGRSRGCTLVQPRRALLEVQRGGRKALTDYYCQPTKYTPDQYLQARVDAAKRALDARNLRLAAMHERGIRSVSDCGSLVGTKVRWYGPKESKWGKAYEDFILREGKWPGHAAWYQWQLVYDAMLAQGRIDADGAARGGRGLETWNTHYDSWDVFGEWQMHVYEVENWFDVPIGK